MRRVLIVLLLTAIAVGCGRSAVQKDAPGQWILESYSAEKGYVFRKDGIRYEAHCASFLSAEAIQSLPRGFILIRPILKPEWEESKCSDILPYLHRTVPLKQGEPFSKDVLLFPKAEDGSFKDGVFEFLITEAK